MDRTGDWIPVEKMLPKIKEHYPGTGTGSSKQVMVYSPDCPEGPVQVWRCYRGGRGDTTSIHWDYDYKVTHWMPLPPPPIP
jgi:hypothetical protein